MANRLGLVLSVVFLFWGALLSEGCSGDSYWVDISKQVMAKPIKISGDGRVAALEWQPVNAR